MKDKKLFLVLGFSLLLPNLFGSDLFSCPEEFGYFKDPRDCSRYYVCVYGSAVHETCAGGLLFSQPYLTCDWPRNVKCEIFEEKFDITEAPTTTKQQSRQQQNVVESKNAESSYESTQTNQDKNTIVNNQKLRNKTTIKTRTDQPDQTKDNTGEFRIPRKQTQQKESINYLQIKEDLKPESPSFGSKVDRQDFEYFSESQIVPKISEVERELLKTYPGVSTKLEDQKFDDLNSYYYTEWDNSQFSDIFYDFDNQDFQNPLAQEILDDLSLSRSKPEKSHRKCSPSDCLLPSCHCGGTRLNHAAYESNSQSDWPQIVLLTFEGAINDLNKRLFEELFTEERVNPNGCPISATFYVSHEWTDYSQVENLYKAGHEIASHGISYGYGELFSKEKWGIEMSGQRSILAKYANISEQDIRGIRAPFLAIGGNNMFAMLQDANFTYDSSMPIYENTPPSFPYTMDYRMHHACMIPPCPTKSFPGVWEVPLVMWNDLYGGRCSMGDACNYPDSPEGVYRMIMTNFNRHYSSNRAPFNMFYSPAWFSSGNNKEGFELVLDALMSMKDVWIVSTWQMLQWMRQPVTKQQAYDFKPFQCKDKAQKEKCLTPNVCTLWHRDGLRYMKTCQKCPQFYPWID